MVLQLFLLYCFELTGANDYLEKILIFADADGTVAKLDVPLISPAVSPGLISGGGIAAVLDGSCFIQTVKLFHV